MGGYIKDVVAGGDFKRYDELMILPFNQVIGMAANIKQRDYIRYLEEKRQIDKAKAERRK